MPPSSPWAVTATSTHLSGWASGYRPAGTARRADQRALRAARPLGRARVRPGRHRRRVPAGHPGPRPMERPKGVRRHRPERLQADRAGVRRPGLDAGRGRRTAVAVGSTLALGARVAQEVLGIPTATVHLSPAAFQSVHEMARLPGLGAFWWTPRWFKGGLWWTVNRVVDRAMAPPLNAYRATRGLPPVRDVFPHVPALAATGAGDVPRLVRGGAAGLAGELARGRVPAVRRAGGDAAAGGPGSVFGGRPAAVAFTPGSAMFAGRAFFAASAEACRLSSRRGVLLSRHRDHIPADLPPGVVHADYAPFSELLPRCAAVVHHGGVGTCAQAWRPGCRSSSNRSPTTSPTTPPG